MTKYADLNTILIKLAGCSRVPLARRKGAITSSLNTVTAWYRKYQAINGRKLSDQQARAWNRAALAIKHAAGSPGIEEQDTAFRTAVRLYTTYDHPGVAGEVLKALDFATNAPEAVMEADLGILRPILEPINVPGLQFHVDPSARRTRSFDGSGIVTYSKDGAADLLARYAADGPTVLLGEVTTWIKALSVTTDEKNQPKIDGNQGLPKLATLMEQVAQVIKGVRPVPVSIKNQTVRTPATATATATASQAPKSSGNRVTFRAKIKSTAASNRTLLAGYYRGAKFRAIVENLLNLSQASGMVTTTVADIFAGVNTGDPKRMLKVVADDGIATGGWTIVRNGDKVVFTCR